MRNYFFAILFFVVAISFAQQSTLPIIPQPNEITLKEGNFVLSPNTKIVLRNADSFKNDISWFNDYLEKNYGFRLETTANELKSGDFIQFGYPDFEAGFKENYHF